MTRYRDLPDALEAAWNDSGEEYTSGKSDFEVLILLPKMRFGEAFDETTQITL